MVNGGWPRKPLSFAHPFISFFVSPGSPLVVKHLATSYDGWEACQASLGLASMRKPYFQSSNCSHPGAAPA